MYIDAIKYECKSKLYSKTGHYCIRIFEYSHFDSFSTSEYLRPVICCPKWYFHFCHISYYCIWPYIQSLGCNRNEIRKI